MRPYYEHAGITIYHGDCREVIPIVTMPIDAVVTDPPYGVDLGVGGSERGRGDGHGLSTKPYASYDDTYEEFVNGIVPRLNLAIDRACRAAIFTGPHIHEQKKPSALGGVFCPSANGRHPWGFKSLLPVLFYGTAPDLQKGSKATVLRSTETAEKNGHPVPKPIGWMRWLVGLASRPGEVVLDPFAGSGTTLVAAKDLGRIAIGIEIEERYCEIAAKRLAQETLFGVGR